MQTVNEQVKALSQNLKVDVDTKANVMRSSREVQENQGTPREAGEAQGKNLSLVNRLSGKGP